MPDLAEQTRNAFGFIEKLYLETSYLIKEVEGQLQQMPEGFVILRPAGYGVSSLTSTGLEAKNVSYWLRKRLAVAFVPEALTQHRAGQTHTAFLEDLRVMFLTLVFFADELNEPTAFFGYVDHIENKTTDWKKFERFMWEFPSSAIEMLNRGPTISFDDGYCSMSGEVKKLKLYSLNTSEDVRKKLVEPMVKLYRKK